MTKINPNDYAYPQMHGIDNSFVGGGMTIRAQMAAMICAGLVSSPDSTTTMQEDAQSAVAQADALIAELNKENT